MSKTSPSFRINVGLTAHVSSFGTRRPDGTTAMSARRLSAKRECRRPSRRIMPAMSSPCSKGRTRRSCAVLIAFHLVAGPSGAEGTPEPANTLEDGRQGAGGSQTAVRQSDRECLRTLDSKGVSYQQATAAGGMRTPVEITGPIGGVALIPRGRRSPLMDCVLARALLRAENVFGELGIAAMTFSAAYDYRTRRGSSEPSAHAYGLAIDVHTVRGPFGEYDVGKQFERGRGAWRGLTKGPDALGACVGEPATSEGRTLRRLACLLKLHPAFRVIVSPDDNADHHDHLHIEASSDFFPPQPGAPPLAPLTPSPARPLPGQAVPRNHRPTTTKPALEEKARAKAKAKAKERVKAKAKAKAMPKVTPKPKPPIRKSDRAQGSLTSAPATSQHERHPIRWMSPSMTCAS